MTTAQIVGCLIYLAIGVALVIGMERAVRRSDVQVDPVAGSRDDGMTVLGFLLIVVLWPVYLGCSTILWALARIRGK
ncbi:MAG: hypothetical protein PHX83_06595 [Acidobacteriia bacterium]|nr:hypothetical protein [Terriglobia bacterium]